MAAPVYQMNFEQDIAFPITIRHGGMILFTGDNLADTVSVSILENGAAHAISGTVTMNCIRADGATVAVTGSVSGNTASATLTQACVAIPGPLAVVMKITSDSTTTTLLKAIYTVDIGVTGTAVDPGTIIPDINALISAVETAIGSIPADYSDLLAAIAPSFNPEASTPYPAGSYVWYPGLSNNPGALYRFTAAHSGSWTGSDVEAVVFGNVITDLKSAFMYSLDGVQTFYGLGNFQHYGLNTDGSFKTTQQYRVSNDDPMTFDRNLTITVANGFKWGYIPFINNTPGAWAGWFTSDYTIPKDTSFVVQIARATEDFSEIADVGTFLSALTFNSIATDNINELIEDANGINDLFYGASYSFTGKVSAINKFNMPLFEGLKYTATNNTGANIGIDLYKADGTSKSISASLANGSSVEFTVDAPDYTQIGGWFNAGSTGALVVTCDYSVFDKIAELDSEVEDNIDDILTVSENVDGITKTQNIQRTDYVKKAGYFFNTNNQDYTAAQWDYYTLSVNEGEQYTIDTKAGQSARAWIFRNSSQAIISMDSYSDTPVQATYNVTVPENAVEMIMNGQPSGTFSITQNNAETVDEDKIIYKNKSLPQYLDDVDGKTGNILAGKILCCCGDSITYGADMDSLGIITPTIESYQYSAYTKTWTRWTDNEPAAYGYQIAARNGMIFYNGGVSGATVQGSGDDISVPGFSVADGEYTLLPENIDYLTLFYGWNDTAFGTLGTIDDNTNASYYGAYNVVLPYLINKYPYTKIGIIVPFGCDAGHREAVRLLANKWGIACFDNYQGGTPLYYGKEDSVGVESSIVTANRTKFQANGAHPNYKGHKQLADMIEQWIRGI
jgi:lysophospholipase L1-like esterase